MAVKKSIAEMNMYFRTLSGFPVNMFDGCICPERLGYVLNSPIKGIKIKSWRIDFIKDSSVKEEEMGLYIRPVYDPYGDRVFLEYYRYHPFDGGWEYFYRPDVAYKGCLPYRDLDPKMGLLEHGLILEDIEKYLLEIFEIQNKDLKTALKEGLIEKDVYVRVNI